MTVDAPSGARPTASGFRSGVEFAGLPGSGKSRRARMLAESLAARGIDVSQPRLRLDPAVPAGRRLARKALAAGAVTAASPLGTARVVRGIARSHQPGAADLARRIVQWLVTQEVTARAGRSTGVGLVDEGVVQALWSIGLRGDVRPVLAALDSCSRPAGADLLVVVRVPPEVAMARLAARTSRNSRTQLLAEDDGLAELRRGARLLDDLVAWWAAGAAGTRPVVTLDGTADDTADHRMLVDRICARA